MKDITTTWNTKQNYFSQTNAYSPQNYSLAGYASHQAFSPVIHNHSHDQGHGHSHNGHSH